MGSSSGDGLHAACPKTVPFVIQLYPVASSLVIRRVGAGYATLVFQSGRTTQRERLVSMPDNNVVKGFLSFGGWGG